MATPDWTRPHWSRDEAKAMLVYFVFGEFPDEPKLDLTAHGGHGLPQGVEILRIPKDRLAHWEGHPLRGAIGEILREGNPGAFELARKAPECLMLHGELADADSLAYLRDTLGVLAALLEVGGVAVVDPQILEMLSADGWRARYTADTIAASRSHVLVLCQDDAGGDAWIKTRGMRKFARPDISIRGVPQSEVQRAGAVAARLTELQARGMRFGDDSTVDVEGMAAGLKIKRGGSLDDPEFNNTHLAIEWET